MGKEIELITPHSCYLSLGKTNKERQVGYQSLFDSNIPDYTLDQICNVINRVWVLGDSQFIEQIEAQTGRRASPPPGVVIENQKNIGQKKKIIYTKPF